MKIKSRVTVLLSDTHIGSTVGLWPEDFISNEGFPIGQNPLQKWLWKCWKDCEGWIEGVVGDDDYDVVVNGDVVEGIHHRTTQVMSADVSDQTTAALAILGPMAEKASQIHLIKGTECHTRNDEIRMGKVLGATKDPQTGQHAWDNLDLEMNGTLMNFAHHISTTTRPYLEASAHSIALGVITHSRARVGKRVPSVICRAHRHRHGIWTDGNQASLITGAWQGLTRHGHKVVPDAVIEPSCIILDSRNTDKGDLPLFHQRKYIH
jgi:hypothetical protein